LVEVEGLAELLDAKTERQHLQAIYHSSGGASSVFEGWRKSLINCLAMLEASIDFAEEEGLEESALENLTGKLELLHQEISSRIRNDKLGEQIRDGFKVVLAGPPNVGKSSLFNLFCQRDAAIVSPQAGTTRDVIEVYLDLQGLPVILMDSAGIHDGEVDEVEYEGMLRSRSRIADADLVIWVTVMNQYQEGPPPIVDSDTLWVKNKSDLYGEFAPDTMKLEDNSGKAVSVSAKTGKGFDHLLNTVHKMLYGRVNGIEPALVTRERHAVALRNCAQHIAGAIEIRLGNRELVCEEIRLAIRELGKLTGRVDVEELLDVIFREFCLGK